MLKPIIETQPEVQALAEALRNEYEQRDGAWHLKIEGGYVSRAKFEEFRENNHTLSDQVKTLTADLKRFEGIDPQKAFALMDREKEIMDEKLVKAGKIEEVVADRIQTAKNEHQRQIEAKDARIKELDGVVAKTTASLKQVKIHNVLISEASARGLQKGAERFLLDSAEKVWDLDENGSPIVKDEMGKVVYGASGDPMKPGEWLDGLQRTSAFMFTKNNGSGAQGSGAGAGAGAGAVGEVNWWKAETWNPGKQMELYGKDRAAAERMAQAAGKKIGAL